MAQNTRTEAATRMSMLRRKRRANQRRQQTAKLRQRGYSPCAIADALGISVKTVYHHVKQLEGGIHPSDDEKRQYVELYETGASMTQIARQFNRSVMTVSKWINHACRNGNGRSRKESV